MCIGYVRHAHIIITRVNVGGNTSREPCILGPRPPLSERADPPTTFAQQPTSLSKRGRPLYCFIYTLPFTLRPVICRMTHISHLLTSNCCCLLLLSPHLFRYHIVPGKWVKRKNPPVFNYSVQIIHPFWNWSYQTFSYIFKNLKNFQRENPTQEAFAIENWQWKSLGIWKYRWLFLDSKEDDWVRIFININKNQTYSITNRACACRLLGRSIVLLPPEVPETA